MIHFSTEDVTQVVEHLPSKHKAMSSNTSTTHTHTHTQTHTHIIFKCKDIQFQKSTFEVSFYRNPCMVTNVTIS
jgi:hypothetical protein